MNCCEFKSLLFLQTSEDVSASSCSSFSEEEHECEALFAYFTATNHSVPVFLFTMYLLLTATSNESVGFWLASCQCCCILGIFMCVVVVVADVQTGSVIQPAAANRHVQSRGVFLSEEQQRCS